MLTHQQEAKRRAFHTEHGIMVYVRIVSAIAFAFVSFVEFKDFQLLQGMLLAFCIASFGADIFSLTKMRKARRILDEADFISTLTKSENAARGLGIVSLSMVFVIGAVALKFIPFPFLWVGIIAQFSSQSFELFTRTRILLN